MTKYYECGSCDCVFETGHKITLHNLTEFVCSAECLFEICAEYGLVQSTDLEEEKNEKKQK